ncbi:CAP domain-containing protein [Streptomyces sp. NPDC059456]|uniref:CAP domain-containing protein n=1 Tax=Streptomyces sp. NPDC059456 TaxID=3346838 RepID=UPI0036AC28F6
MRTRIVLSVTAAAAAVAVGVAVADSDGAARGSGHTDGAAGPLSGKSSADAGTNAPTAPVPTGEASAPASPSPSGTPGADASASATPAQPSAAESSTEAKSASAQTDKPTRKPAGKGSGSGGSTGTGGSGGSGGSGTVDANSESAVLALVNKERATAGCGPLTTNSKLSAAARAYSDTMARSGVMSHTGPDGSTMTSRVEAAGYTWSNLGENIARGQADADAVMDAWMHSPGHRANILNCAFKEIGIGVHKGDGGPWWTQDFGASR